MARGPARLKVPVFEVAGEAWRFVFTRFGLVLELAWLPLLLLLAASILPELLLPVPAEKDPQAAALQNLPLAIVTVAQLLCLSAIAVRLQQVLLHGLRRALPPHSFARAYSRFIVYGLIANIVLQGLAVVTVVGAYEQSVVSAILVVAGVVVMVLLGLAAARLALLFPAAAYGEPLSPRAAWRLMRGNTWRLIAGSCLTCVPFVLVAAFLFLGILDGIEAATVHDRTQALGIVLLRGVFGTVADVMVVALGAALLCGFYRRVVLPGAGPSPTEI